MATIQDLSNLKRLVDLVLTASEGREPLHTYQLLKVGNIVLSKGAGDTKKVIWIVVKKGDNEQSKRKYCYAVRVEILVNGIGFKPGVHFEVNETESFIVIGEVTMKLLNEIVKKVSKDSALAIKQNPMLNSPSSPFVKKVTLRRKRYQ